MKELAWLEKEKRFEKLTKTGIDMKKSPSRTDDNSTDESSRSNRDDRKSYRSWDDDRGPLTIFTISGHDKP